MTDNTGQAVRDAARVIYEFDRYINGKLMAEGVTVEREKTLEDACRVAARIASRGPNGEAPVLVLASLAPNAKAVDIAAKIIDPDAWHETLPTDGCGVYWIGRRNKATTQAAEIIAALANLAPEAGEAIVASLIRDAIDIGTDEAADHASRRIAAYYRAGKEPRGCPTPGACSCLPATQPPTDAPEAADVRKAIKITEYKYFGDYEFSDDQREAVDTLVDFARATLAARQPEVVDRRKPENRCYTVAGAVTDREEAVATWVRKAMRFIDLCDADPVDYADCGLHEDAERLTIEGYLLFGADVVFDKWCLADLERRKMVAFMEPAKTDEAADRAGYERGVRESARVARGYDTYDNDTIISANRAAVSLGIEAAILALILTTGGEDAPPKASSQD